MSDLDNTEFVFTPENLIENLDKLGAWSSYGLASIALQHYFPDEYEPESPSTSREAELLEKLGFEFWGDVVVKYHNEVGYKILHPDYVNER